MDVIRHDNIRIYVETLAELIHLFKLFLDYCTCIGKQNPCIRVAGNIGRAVRDVQEAVPYYCA